VGFLKRIFGGGGDAEGASVGAPADDAEWLTATEATFDVHRDRHRVTVWLRLYDPEFESTREQMRVFELENRIMRALEEAGAGEHDTNALERGFLGIRLVGDDADAIVTVVLPLLDDVPAGSYLAVRRGPVPTGEDRVELGPAEPEPAADIAAGAEDDDREPPVDEPPLTPSS
jgi:hypothetical protein